MAEAGNLPTAAADETRDVLMRGRVRLIQARKGYRSSVDAMVLAWFATIGGSRATRCLDLGTGTGLVAVLLGMHQRQIQLDLIERQPALAARARRNLLLNGLAERAEVHVLDIGLQQAPPCPRADLIVCNPPYHSPVGRMLPEDRERREAHYETTADLARFAAVARSWATTQAEFCVIYPAERADHAAQAMLAAGWSHCERTWLHHRDFDEAATRVLLRGRSQGRHGLVDRAAIQLHQPGRPDHIYNAEVERFIEELGPQRWP